jgi:hypothetical protein
VLLGALTCWAGAASVQAAPRQVKVRVPRVRGDVVSVYARLHALGLRVRIPRAFAYDSAAPPQVVATTPRAGRRVRRGSVVTLYLARSADHAVSARGRLRSYVVPRLVGDEMSAAYAWAAHKRLIFRAYLPPLAAGNAPGLFANYVVIRQSPRPGSRLSLGRRGQSKPRGHGRGRFHATPLSVRAALRPPLAITGSARSITQTSATLTATVDPNGQATTYYFSYGTSTAYASATPVRSAGFGNARTTVTSALQGLTLATTYHYRLVVRSKAGTVYGADATFITAGNYQNPVYGPAELPDPFVLDNGGTHSDYWAFGTGPRFPMLHSSDLVHWVAEGTAMSTRPAWVVKTGDWHPWAPSLLVSDQPCPGGTSGGCYVMYYVGLSAQLHVNCIGVATSPLPGGPYIDQGPLDLNPATPGGPPLGCADSTGSGNIDPSPFIDPSGQAYLYVSTDRTCNGGSCQWQPTLSAIPLTPDFLHASGPRVALFGGSPGTWEAAGGVSAPTVEGPAMALHNGTYYLFYSGGNWQGAYGMGYATSSSPTGPFTKNPDNPILAQTSTVFSPGGGDRIVTGPHNGLWLVYAGRSKPSPAPRTLRIDPLSWAPPGSSGGPDVPVVNGPTATPQATLP